MKKPQKNGLNNIYNQDPDMMEKDDRPERIIEQILKLTALDFEARGTISGKGDEMDAIIAGLNSLGEQLFIRSEREKRNEERIESLLNLLLSYTMLDFSQKAPLTEEGDAIDAIAAGINSLREEIQIYIRQIRESQERIETIISNAPEAVIVIDDEHCIVEWNPRAETFFQWKKEEALGKSFLDIIIPYRYHESISELKKYLQEGKDSLPNKTIELTVVRKDNSEFEGGLNIAPFDYHEKKYFIGFIKDITARKKAEAQLIAVNQELDSFTYSVSHDLRAPLRSIDGYSRVFLEDYGDKLDEEGKRTLNVITRNALKMGRLIDDLLAFSRLGKQNLTKVNLDMNVIVNQVISELSQDQTGRIVQFDVKPLANIRGDGSMIRQVMTNLISNALKYSGKKEKAIIEISSFTDADQIVYSVKDNGAGFDMQYYDKLFGVFQRLHNVMEFEGTGVGLALVQRIIKKHGGKVWAEGKPGEGATFHFSIPVN